MGICVNLQLDYGHILNSGDAGNRLHVRLALAYRDQET